MPVQIFVGRGPEGKPLSPDYSHEMRATVDIIKRLWTAFHHHQPYYAVIANLNDPSVDLMIISERGIGIVELKHYYGPITCHTNGTWYAGPKRMQAGVEGKGFKNPHEQVQSYIEHIRKSLLNPPLWQEPWLPGKTIDWPDFKFHTAVCFTHPDADLTGFEEQLRKRCRPITLPWEDFSVLIPDDLTEWAASLRFEVGAGRTKQFSRYRFDVPQINRIITELFNLFPWTEIYELLPSGAPYAFLTMLENDSFAQVYALDSDEMIIGRDLNSCDVVIPYRFSLVSRVHARITRTAHGIYIEDLGSTNGTYLDGQRVLSRPIPIEHGQRITLGRAVPASGVCLLEYSLQVDVDEIEATKKLGLNRRQSSSETLSDG